MFSRAAAGLMIVAYIGQVWASCAYGTILHPRAEGGKVEVGKFGYIGTTGPANWVALDAANALCANGTNQSPINMLSGRFSAIPAAGLSLDIPDMTEGTSFENLGTTVEVVAKGGQMSFGGVNYTLQQFHFHLPSEHLNNGASTAMEMHMVLEGGAGEVGVIGVFIDINDKSEAVPSVPPASPRATPSITSSSTPEAVPSDKAAAKPRSASREMRARRQTTQRQIENNSSLPALKVQGTFFHVNAPTTAAMTPSALLENVFGSVGEIATPGTVTKTRPLVMSELVNTLLSGSFQTYEGSLTSPPCSEGVRWFVSNQVLSIQPETFTKARSVIGFNARFPQNELGTENLLSQRLLAGR
ncbi:Uncharacterized protein TPAR_02144 [Tolypocladium paradoxum]|uniref:carbonic anhydrase n=1 Tax=Tolypocladium paradoxum TaxID=94208 RepID=A0A2S4L5F3_9HYPO|nr:Uncharacterized protein TPAR_02144 [Tolypocladium paradoxum]